MTGHPAVILAGGASRRMGGGDKFLLPFGQSTMIAHVATRVARQAGPLAVSANCDPALLADLRLPVLADMRHAGRGPLSGVLAGLDWAQGSGAQKLLTVAADTPFFPRDLAARLAETDDRDAVAVARSGGRPHPTFALWPLACAAALDDFLSSETNSSVMAFVRSLPHSFVDFDEGASDPFFNVNTPQDMIRAQALLGPDA